MTTDRTAPRRRWSFSLRTLFVVVTVCAVALWLGGIEWLIVLAMRIQGIKC